MIPFNSYCQDAEQKIVLNVKPKRNEKISSIGFFLIYRNNANNMYVTDVMMSIDESGTSYTYDSDGNLISALDNATRNQTYTYNDVGEITSYTDQKSNKYVYNYTAQNKHRLDSMYSEGTLTGFEFEYDNYGNITQVKAGQYSKTNSALTPLTSMSYGYDSTADYVTSITDERGLTSIYDIDILTGLTNSTTIPATVLGIDKNIITRYTYDEDNHNLLSAGLYSQDAPNTLISGVSYTYDNSVAQLKRITRTDGLMYNFLYDIWGRITDIKVGNRLLSHSVYRKTNSNDNQLSYTEYGNGARIYYNYDALDRIVSESTAEGGTPYVSYKYNNEGLVSRVTDDLAGVTTEYQYDLLGRLTSSNMSDGDIGRYFYSYDESNNLTGMSAYLYPYSSWNLQCRYYYGADDLQTLSEQGNYSIYYTYDGLNRKSGECAVENTTGNTLHTSYEYFTAANGNSTSFISRVVYETSTSRYGTRTLIGSIEYTYDQSGFISSVIMKDANGSVTSSESYTYDELGQLKTVTNGSNVTEYTYDTAGNILTKKYNGTTVGSYTYGNSEWKDLLTSYNGTAITYDTIGNPTSYVGWDTLTWSMGRRLTAMSNSTTNVSYVYDASGKRVSKTVNGTTTEFYYDDRGALVLSTCSDGTDIYFYPDANGSIGSISYNGNSYYYVRNAQNDIIGITDKTGVFVARYTYDEWGNVVSITDGNGNDVSNVPSHIAYLNPLRYRSYYYDTETGFYWLNTRYYDSSVGRFINADAYASTGQGVLGYNMFAYCGNNAVNGIDAGGTLWGLIVGIVTTIFVLPLLISCENREIKQEEAKEVFDQIHKNTRMHDDIDSVAISLADKAFNTIPSEDLIEYEYACGIYEDEFGRGYYAGSLTRYSSSHSFAGDMSEPTCVASFHTHPVQLSTGFSGLDIRGHYENIIKKQSDHIEYLFHKNNDSNLYELIRYDKTMPLGTHQVVKVYGEK